MNKICIIGGAGHIGFPLGLYLASKKNKVYLYDKNKRSCEIINSSNSPHFELKTDYFIKKYPNKIFSLDLEELTNNPEETSKKIYSFSNLKWNETVLDFHKRKDLIISTASNIQIRRNIQKYDHEKYRPYKEFLKKFSHKYTWIHKD